MRRQDSELALEAKITEQMRKRSLEKKLIEQRATCFQSKRRRRKPTKMLNMILKMINSIKTKRRFPMLQKPLGLTQLLLWLKTISV